jgi:hypothetical protein
LKYVENTEYTENLTESEKRKLRKQAKHCLIGRFLKEMALEITPAIAYHIYLFSF